MTRERTFICIKPDGVQRGLIGQVVSRFEAKGFKLVGMKFIKASQELLGEHYAEHKERPFFGALTGYMSSGPVVPMVWEGNGVVAAARKMLGATKPLESAPGTIRGDFCIDVGRNLVHGSDSVESAQREIGLWFSADEQNEWESHSEGWLYE